MDSNQIFEATRQDLVSRNFNIVDFDFKRPWGGFFVIDEQQAQEFANAYFNGLDVSSLRISGKLSPKILLVAPNQRLSWQYHNRRAEIWRAIQGNAGVVISDTDTEGDLKTLNEGEFITLRQGERHRLVGLNNWAVIAEIWQHTNPELPSDESDIVRVQDDFGRN